MNMIEKVARAIRDSFNSNDIDCIPLAEAAIEAMREPTKEMITRTEAVTIVSDETCERIYISMINTALNET